MSEPEPTPVRVEFDADGGIRVRPAGPLDAACTDSVRDVIEAAAGTGAPRIEIDLRDISTVDLDRLSLIEAAARVARAHGVDCKVTRTQGLTATAAEPARDVRMAVGSVHDEGSTHAESRVERNGGCRQR